MTDRHDFSQFALGRKHGVIVDRRTPMLADFIERRALPRLPNATNMGSNLRFDMLGNDTNGDCGFAAKAHLDHAISRSHVEPPADAVLSAYYAFTKAHYGGGDTGVYLLDVLKDWGHASDLTSDAIEAFVAVNLHDRRLVHAATWIFGGLYIGMSLPVTAQRQQLWDDTGHQDSESRPGSWGGHCLAPTARVLTAGLEWVQLGDVEEGDELLAFDEEPTLSQRRWWKRTVVEGVKRLRLPCYELEFADGTVVRASSDHRWLVGKAPARWVATDKLVAGPSRVSRVVKPLNVWETDVSRTGGYLAGAFDGEGCLSLHGNNNKAGRSLHRLAFYQNDNEMLSGVAAGLEASGYTASRRIGTPGVAGTRGTLLAVHGREQLIRFLGSVRPPRLLGRLDLDALGMMSGPTVPLVRKEYVGEREVVALQTDARTYVAEGLASHNCVYLNASYGVSDQSLTCITWGQRQRMTWAFWKRYVDEAYAVIHPDWLARHHGKAPNGFDYPALQSYLEEVR